MTCARYRRAAVLDIQENERGPLRDAAHRPERRQGRAFGLANLAWAAGQAIVASASCAIAQATPDFVPHTLLAATCLATFSGSLRSRAAG